MKTIPFFFFSWFFLISSAFALTNPEQTLEQAFLNNPNLKLAQENRQATFYDIQKAKASFYPTIGLWTNLGVARNTNSTTKAYNTEYDNQGYGGVSLSIKQNLYAGGANTANVKASEAQFTMADNLLIDSATTLAFEALSAHGDLYRRYILLSLAENNIKEHEAILATTQLRFKQGVITEGEVTQVESRLARAHANLQMHIAGLEAAKANYLRVVGMVAPNTLSVLSRPSLIFNSSEEASIKAETHNARLEATKNSVQMNINQKKVAEARFYPQLYLQGGVSTRYQQGTGNDNTHGYDIGLVGQWEFYSGGVDKANLSKAETKIRQAQLEVIQFQDQINQDIQGTFSKTQAAFQQADYYLNAMDLSKKTKKNFIQQFEAGTRGLLDVLDAEQEYYNSAIEKEISYIDGIIGEYRLLALTGTLLEELNININNFRINP